MLYKGWKALGAFDPAERTHALDLLGFNRQLVFTTFALSHFWGIFKRGEADPNVVYGGARAHNRAIAEFCAGDKRLMAVGFVPLDDADLAAREIDEAIKLGCAAIHIPSVPPEKFRRPTRSMTACGRAFRMPTFLSCCMSAAAECRFPKAFFKNDRPVTDFLGGGENFHSKDFMVGHYGPETFLSAMVLDGIFEKFPRLRGGCIEQGAMWIVPWLRRLDISQDTFVRTEPCAAPADEGVGLRAPPAQVHAVSA